MRLNEVIRGFLDGLAVKNPPAMQETQEMWVRYIGWEDPLEEEITTHSSILAWRIPWTKEPGGPWSIASQSWTQLKQLSTHTQNHQPGALI